MKVKLHTATLLDGEHQPIGKELDVTPALAAILVPRKAYLIEEGKPLAESKSPLDPKQAPPPAEPDPGLTTETAGALVKGSKKKRSQG